MGSRRPTLLDLRRAGALELRREGGSRSGSTPSDDGRRSMRGEELRSVTSRIELRADDGAGDGPGTLLWYPAVYEQLSLNLGFFLGFREKIARGAFDRTVAEDDVRALFNHDDNFVLGRSRPGNVSSTLSLYPDDAHGLRAELPLPGTTFAADLAESVRRRDVDQGSFGFTTRRDEWDYNADLPDDDEPDDDLMFGAGGVLRTLLEVKLYDVSVVTFPAYPQTTADVRSRAASVVRDARGSTGYAARMRRRLALAELQEPA